VIKLIKNVIIDYKYRQSNKGEQKTSYYHH